MYRLTLYYLIFILSVAFLYCVLGILPYNPLSILFSSVFLVGVSFASNKLFEKLFDIQTNIESLYITALILACIVSPIKSLSLNNLTLLLMIAFLAMASKYILNIKRKHIFNPAALGVFIAGIVFHQYASWWIATTPMFPFLLLGILIIRKIRRFDLVICFFLASTISIFITYALRSNFDVLNIVKNIFVDSPILFFAFVMLSEPLTTPPTRRTRISYALLTGILFAPIHIGAFFTSPEIALLIGNIFSYIMSPKQKLILTLKEKVQLTPNIYDFVFNSPEKLMFEAGQYFEWTFGHKNTDTRGNRRYFTISSSPTENEIRIGVKFEQERSSSYKREMLNMKPGDKIVVGNLAGDFTLPKNQNKKLAFIAGGIGITPYRSIIKYLLDSKEKRDIVLLYSEKNKNQMVYKNIFDQAKALGVKTIYYETEIKGHITKEVLKEKIPDYKKRTFYISGSNKVVTSFEKILSNLGIPYSQIKTDYFPGY